VILNAWGYKIGWVASRSNKDKGRLKASDIISLGPVRILNYVRED
jgi:hypothetical protein